MVGDVTSLRITGWDVLSPHGVGRDAFAGPLADHWDAPTPIESWDCPKAVPDFDLKTHVGTKGTRGMDRLTGLSVLTAGMALRDSGHEVDGGDSKDIGLVLGTSTGSVKSITDFTRDTFSQGRAVLVNPGHFPNTVLNCAAGQCAIWHKLRGPNVTLSGGHASFYAVLGYALRALKGGYAKSIVAGAAEEVSEQASWAYRRVHRPEHVRRRPLAEATGMFVLDPADGEDGTPADGVCARILAVELSNAAPSGRRAGLASCITRCLEKAGIGAGDLALLVTHGSLLGDLAAVEREGIDAGLSGHLPDLSISIGEFVGETYSASGAMQLASILIGFESGMVPGDYALATMVSHNGTVASMIIQRGPRS